MTACMWGPHGNCCAVNLLSYSLTPTYMCFCFQAKPRHASPPFLLINLTITLLLVLVLHLKLNGVYFMRFVKYFYLNLFISDWFIIKKKGAERKRESCVRWLAKCRCRVHLFCTLLFFQFHFEAWPIPVIVSLTSKLPLFSPPYNTDADFPSYGGSIVNSHLIFTSHAHFHVHISFSLPLQITILPSALLSLSLNHHIFSHLFNSF